MCEVLTKLLGVPATAGSTSAAQLAALLHVMCEGDVSRLCGNLITCLTSDSTASMDKLIDMLNECLAEHGLTTRVPRVPCVAHVLSLCELKVYEALVGPIPSGMHAWKTHPEHPYEVVYMVWNLLSKNMDQDYFAGLCSAAGVHLPTFLQPVRTRWYLVVQSHRLVYDNLAGLRQLVAKVMERPGSSSSSSSSMWATLQKALDSPALPGQLLLVSSLGPAFFEQAYKWCLCPDSQGWLQQAGRLQPLPAGLKAHLLPDMIGQWVQQQRQLIAVLTLKLEQLQAPPPVGTEQQQQQDREEAAAANEQQEEEVEQQQHSPPPPEQSSHHQQQQQQQQPAPGPLPQVPGDLSAAIDLCEPLLLGVPGLLISLLQNMRLGWQASINALLKHLHPIWQQLPLAASRLAGASGPAFARCLLEEYFPQHARPRAAVSLEEAYLQQCLHEQRVEHGRKLACQELPAGSTINSWDLIERCRLEPALLEQLKRLAYSSAAAPDRHLLALQEEAAACSAATTTNASQAVAAAPAELAPPPPPAAAAAAVGGTHVPQSTQQAAGSNTRRARPGAIVPATPTTQAAPCRHSLPPPPPVPRTAPNPIRSGAPLPMAHRVPSPPQQQQPQPLAADLFGPCPHTTAPAAVSAAAQAAAFLGSNTAVGPHTSPQAPLPTAAAAAAVRVTLVPPAAGGALAPQPEAAGGDQGPWAGTEDLSSCEVAALLVSECPDLYTWICQRPFTVLIHNQCVEGVVCLWGRLNHRKSTTLTASNVTVAAFNLPRLSTALTRLERTLCMLQVVGPQNGPYPSSLATTRS
jgi:hypothetical protein